jgi:hypothetical protein
LLEDRYSDAATSKEADATTTTLRTAATPIAKPIKSIIIFSHDGSESSIQQMLQQWQQGPASGLVDEIKLVPNDAVNVDVSKWISALKSNLHSIWKDNSRVMLLNDSFLLVRNTPELWNDACGGVCGLVWTASRKDTTRHIQSYIRTLSSCEVDNYIEFYELNQHSQNVQELIQKFEVNLDWVHGNVGALFHYAGGHPDADTAQKVLLTHGYPAIKLKKFFETNDPWSHEEEGVRERISPAFEAEVYRRVNHDLNHLSDEKLEEHFEVLGYKEGRIYSRLPLKIKDWMREELVSMDATSTSDGSVGERTLALLEDYLEALNAANEKAVTS